MDFSSFLDRLDWFSLNINNFKFNLARKIRQIHSESEKAGEYFFKFRLILFCREELYSVFELEKICLRDFLCYREFNSLQDRKIQLKSAAWF